jgi:thiol-disulfide isomerase/thioredoxin
MKKRLTLLCFCLFSLTAKSQLPDGIIAPDFTATDINGNSWQLYDLLDQGKSVVIHFMATWCGDCWDYHQNGTLTNLYELYGPNGTDEMVVLMVEVADNTDLADLDGTGDDTYGDWVTGTPFPIIDGGGWVGDLYALDNVPRIYHICTNRVLTNAAGQSSFALHEKHNNCLQAFGSYNAGILLYDGIPTEFCGQATFSPSVRFQNLGTQPLTSATLELRLNGTVAETRQYSGDLDLYEIAGIVFNPASISSTTTVEIAITSVNGQADEDPSNNAVSDEVAGPPITNKNALKVEIQTDDYPREIYWEIQDENGQVWHWGGNPGIFVNQSWDGAYTAANTLYTHEVPLPSDGCWEFVIYDEYNDGICCGGGFGSYRLLEQNNLILLQGGVFTEPERRPFSLSGATTLNNNAGIRTYTGEQGDFCNEIAFTPSIVLQNLGANAISTLDVLLTGAGPTPLLTTWTGNLQPGSVGDIVLEPVILDKTSNLDIQIASVNGQADSDAFLNQHTARLFRRKVEDQHILLQIQTDTWGWETYWELQNSAGVAIASGGNPIIGPNGGGLQIAQESDPGAYPSDTLINVDIALPDSATDCYTLLMVDDWGDGLLDYGFYKIFDANGILLLNTRPLFLYASNLIDAQLGLSATEEQAVQHFSLYPNPTDNSLTVEFYLEESSELQIGLFNALGRQVAMPIAGQYGTGMQRFSFDVSALNSGVYWLRLRSGGGEIVRKVVRG